MSAPNSSATVTRALCGSGLRAFRSGSNRFGPKAPTADAIRPRRRRDGAAADRERLSQLMHALANPARFLRFARPATTWFLLLGLAFATAGMAAGLALTPPDYLQGETV